MWPCCHHHLLKFKYIGRDYKEQLKPCGLQHSILACTVRLQDPDCFNETCKQQWRFHIPILTTNLGLHIPTHCTEPVARWSSLHAKTAEMKGGPASFAAQKISFPPAELAEVIMLCCQVLTGLTLCTATDLADCLLKSAALALRVNIRHLLIRHLLFYKSFMDGENKTVNEVCFCDSSNGAPAQGKLLPSETLSHQIHLQMPRAE